MYSKGISWIDDCRIPFVDDGDIKSQERAFSPNSSSHKGDKWNNKLGWKGSTGPAETTDTRGRFPANLLVSDDMLNDGVISKSGNGKSNTYDKNWIHYGGKYKQRRNADIGDKGTNSRYYDIDKWFDKIIE